MRTRACWAFAALCLFAAPLAGQHPSGDDPDEGTLSSVLPRIPEPLVFDLIRPLGAKKGEFEANSLFRVRPADRPRKLPWAPEVEYTFLDGYGVEFELPLENGHIDAYKAALQGTLRGPAPKRFIHGWQVVGEGAPGGPERQLDLLYLAGFRWHRKWSTFTMSGVRAERNKASRTAPAWLGNYSIFHHYSKKTTLGMESNFKGRGSTGGSILLMPQVHLRGNWFNLQFGTGWQRGAGARGGLQVAARVSREF